MKIIQGRFGTLALAVSALWLLVGGGVAPAAAQQAAGRLHFNFQQLAARASGHNEVELDAATLHDLIGSQGKLAEQNPQLAQVLGGLKGVYVHDFEFARPGAYSPADLEPVLRQLSSPPWHVIVRSDESNERAIIAVQHDEEMITALAIVSIEPNEVAVVNVVGRLPNGLASLGALKALGSLQNLGGLGALGGKSAAATHPKLATRPPAQAAP